MTTDTPHRRDGGDACAAACWWACYDALPCAILLLDEANRVVHANPAACHLLGLPADRALWTEWWQGIQDESGAAAALHAARTTAQAQPPVQVAFTRRDGSRCWVQLDFAPLAPDARMSDASAWPRYAVCAVQDITALKVAEAARQASEERYHQLYEHASDGVYTMDLGGGQYRHLCQPAAWIGPHHPLALRRRGHVRRQAPCAWRRRVQRRVGPQARKRRSIDGWSS